MRGEPRDARVGSIFVDISDDSPCVAATARSWHHATGNSFAEARIDGDPLGRWKTTVEAFRFG